MSIQNYSSQHKIYTMKNLENLKKEFNLIQLEERLELINLATTEVEEGGNGLCCCSDPE